MHIDCECIPAPARKGNNAGLTHLLFRFRHVSQVIVIFCLIVFRSYGGQILQVEGHYLVTQYAANKPLPKKVNIDFVVSLGKNKWKICATNQESKDWEALMYDGTNTYDLMPLGNHFTSAEMDTNIFGAPSKKIPFYATVTSGAHYTATAASFVHVYFPWIAFCLPPQSVNPAWPLPATMFTDFLAPYGYRWKVTPLDGRFIKSISFVRDSSLDLSHKDEYLRPLFRYPPTIERLEDVQRGLALRKATPDGYIVSTYSCQAWCNTNNELIPTEASMTRKVTYNRVLYTIWSLAMHVNGITVTKGDIERPRISRLDGKTFIRDFRYYLRSDDRTFPFATYTTADTWESGDNLKLLAERQHYMKYGPKNGDYGLGSGMFKLPRKQRVILVWSLLALISVLAVIVLVRTNIKSTKGRKT